MLLKMGPLVADIVGLRKWAAEVRESYNGLYFLKACKGESDFEIQATNGARSIRTCTSKHSLGVGFGTSLG